MWLKAYLNGPRPRESSPAVPILPAEIAQDGRNAVDAGAVAQGYATRIGFEDTLVLPNGEPARDNAELIRTARAYGN